MAQDTDGGFEVTVHQSLTQPILLGGVPRSYAILTGTLAAVLGLGLQQLWVALPMAFILHALGVWWTKRDPFWFQVLRRHLREKPYYEA